MMNARKYQHWNTFSADNITFNWGLTRNGQPKIVMHDSTNGNDVALLTPACVTNWPRCTGDGNYGTQWGPPDVTQAKYEIDLTDSDIDGSTNENYKIWSSKLAQLDEKLLDFVHANQFKVLGRKNLSREECKMLQNQSIKPKYQKDTGVQIGNTFKASIAKYGWDGNGGKRNRQIYICNHNGEVLPDGKVHPGDVVAAKVFVNQIWSVNGKFGIHWGFDSVAVICQATKMQIKTEIPEFKFLENEYSFARPYAEDNTVLDAANIASQFSDTSMTVN